MHCIRANPFEFFGTLLTTILKHKEFSLRIGDQIIQKLNFYISDVSQFKRNAKLACMVREVYKKNSFMLLSLTYT